MLRRGVVLSGALGTGYVLRDLYHATTGATVGPMRQGERHELDVAAHNTARHEPFTQRVVDVNRRLEMRGHNPPPGLASHYRRTIQQVENGEITNTRAHARSILFWAQHMNPAGMVANAGGAALSAPHDFRKWMNF